MRAKIVSVLLASLVVTGIASSSSGKSDPPILVPWHKIGDIALGESKARVEQEYGAEGHGYHVDVRNQGFIQGYYRLHGSQVWVTFWDGRVNELDFTTRYYRTTSGFGVGSTIPFGPCHRTATNPCERRWHGFVWNAWRREEPCQCWFKVGLGAQSLPTTRIKFGTPAFAIFIRRGHVSEFYFAQKFVD